MSTGWEYNDLMEVLSQAFEGNPVELEKLLREYPLAKANHEFKRLVVLRKFQERYYKGKRSVLNAAPDGEHFHWGLTIVSVDEDGGSETNVFLPNKYHYTGLSLEGDRVTVMAEGFKKETNITELFRKMDDFFLEFDEKELEAAFETLTNELYEEEEEVKHERPEIKNKVLGNLVYDATYDWYCSSRETNGFSFDICLLDLPAPEEMGPLVTKVETLIRSAYYEKALDQMVPSMLELKNDSWLEEDEKELTETAFRKRISITSITVYNDLSSTIYCDDDDLFWGHSIQVSTDAQGKFKDAYL